MSLTPTTPSFGGKIKSFWAKPEGIYGGIPTLIILAGLGLYGYSKILPWLSDIVWGTAQLVAGGAVLFILLAVLTSKRFWCILSNVFQLIMRKAVGQIVELDPIGIAENTYDQMVDNNNKFSQAIQGTSGAKVSTERQIEKNNSAISKAESIRDEAKSEMASKKNPLDQQRLALNITMQLNEIGRRMHSNEKLQKILDQTTKIYDMLCRWQQLADFQILNLRAEIDNNKEERKAILAAYAGMGFAQKIIQGDPEQLKLLNASLEFMADDNAQKLGAMQDFARYSEKYLSQMDLEQGASAADAEKMLSQYELKLLSSGAPVQTIPAVIIPNQEPVPVLRKKDSNYL